MKPLILTLCVMFASGHLSAQTSSWQPSSGYTHAPIWPGAVPDARPVTGPEVETTNVSRPTMTLRRTKFPITRWPQLVETWLGTIEMIVEAEK
jgi:hypothetical protein